MVTFNTPKVVSKLRLVLFLLHGANTCQEGQSGPEKFVSVNPNRLQFLIMHTNAASSDRLVRQFSSFPVIFLLFNSIRVTSHGEFFSLNEIKCGRKTEVDVFFVVSVHLCAGSLSFLIFQYNKDISWTSRACAPLHRGFKADSACLQFKLVLQMLVTLTGDVFHFMVIFPAEMHFFFCMRTGRHNVH